MREQPWELVNRIERMGQQVRPRSLEKSIHANTCPVCDDRCECGEDEATKRRWKIYHEGLDWRRVEE